MQRAAYPDEDPADANTYAAGLDLVTWFGPTAGDLCRAYPNGGVPSCEEQPSDVPRRQWVSLRRRA